MNDQSARDDAIRREEAVRRVAEEYRRRGFDVEIKPRGSSVPKFVEGALPDLIARRPSESIIVGVQYGSRSSVLDRWGETARRAREEPGWRFDLVFVAPDEPEPVFEGPKPSLDALEQRARSARTLLQGAESEAAFLLLWSALEGALRLIADRETIPVTTLPASGLIRELYSAGEISRQQFNEALRLLPIQNQLVHGAGCLERADTEHLQRLVQDLLAEVKAA
jgi:hypothetical protein